MGRFHLPANHQPAIRVPYPGSSCHNCAFVSHDGNGPVCTNRDYQEFMGTDHLIDPNTRRRVFDPQQYCSDWYQPAR